MFSVIPKGRHTKWKFPKRVKGNLCYRFKFDESARYNHKDHDQKDWNKLIGVKRKFFKPMYDSVMLAWRYDIEKDVIQLTDYYHIKGQRIIDTDIKEVKINEWFDVKITNPFKKGWLILNWFGGQKKAPHKISIEYEMD